MEPCLDDPEVTAGLASLGAGLDRLQGLDLDRLDAREVAGLLGEAEVMARRLSAVQVQVLDAVDRRGVFRPDGHFSAKTMVRHIGKLSNGAAAARDKTMKALRHLPEIEAAFLAGAVGVDQVNLLARVWANARVRDLMADRQQRFLADAGRLSYADFEVEVRSWERRVDQDGPEPANERSHRNRDAKMIQDHFDLGWSLAGNFAAMQGASMREIFDHYIDAELLADWEKARAEHGDNACEADLARTDHQRRADALWQLFHDAANSAGSAVPVGFVHNIIWDETTFEEMLARLDPDHTPEPLDHDDYQCRTVDGTQLDPTEAMANALVSKARRVVVDAQGVTIDLGAARLFTGLARLAVQLGDAHCAWPGCAVPTSRCHIDHTRPHACGGQTHPANGGPFCGHHNRHKERGFTVWRDPTGAWHTHRPNGTEIL